MMGRVSFWGVSGVALMIGVSAMAQQQAAQSATAKSAAASPSGLEEVVVTARRREEKLQAVPIAASVVSGEALTEHSITDATDLGKIVPALSVADRDRRERQA